MFHAPAGVKLPFRPVEWVPSAQVEGVGPLTRPQWARIRRMEISRSSLSHAAFALLILGLLAPGTMVAADEHEGSQEVAGDTALGEEMQGEEEEEGLGEHRDSLALFLGATESDGSGVEKEDPRFTFGLEYERHLTELFGVGVVLERVGEDDRETLLLVPAFFHVGAALFQIAPGVQKADETDSDYEAVGRFGFGWEFEVRERLFLVPMMIFDFTDEREFLVLGVSIGRRF